MSKADAGARVAVLGASPKEERYSFKAVRMLKERGFAPLPIHPAGHTVDGIEGLKSLEFIKNPVDTVTVYVNREVSSQEHDRIIELKPRRVIFNPGAENHILAAKLEKAGMEVVIACTLVLLRTDKF